MSQVLLIDCDIIVYRCGFACERRAYVVETMDGVVHYSGPSHREAIEYTRKYPETTFSIEYKVVVEPVEHAIQNARTTLEAIVAAHPSASYVTFLSGSGNYRYDLATIRPYKGNRSKFSKPIHYVALREYLGKAGAIVVNGMEADDEIGIRATELAEQGLEPIIVSTDKDLDMIPCKHYNWVKKEEYDVTDEEAIRNFYRQCLTGDSVDNVPGIEGVGPVTAGKILANCRRPAAMLYEVRKAWDEAYPSGVERHDGSTIATGAALLEVARLLWIKRSREEPLWHPKM